MPGVRGLALSWRGREIRRRIGVIEFMAISTTTAVIGKVVQVAGPAVDCEFPEGLIPEVHTAIRITSEGFDVPSPIDIICEAQQHLGEGRVRSIAMKPTEGLVRGMRAESLGHPIMVPVGKETLGRVPA